IVHAAAALPWTELDLRDLPDSEQAQRVQSFLAEDQARGFDLANAPLLRCALLRLGPEAYSFVWTYHHILLDGWSSALLFSELFGIYEAMCRAVALRLPSPRPYSDYIAWLKQQDLPRAEAYWRKLLEGFSAPVPLRLGSPARAAQARVPVPEEQRLSA